MAKERVLLPGITVLTRLVGEVRRAESARLYGLLAERTPAETAAALRGLLVVREDQRVSELERLRTSPVKASGRVLVRELDRVAEIAGSGPGGCRSSRCRRDVFAAGADRWSDPRARLWRTNTPATYGPLDHMSGHTVRLDRIRAGSPSAIAGSSASATAKAWRTSSAPSGSRYAVVWWNTLCLDAAVKQIRKGGFPATDDTYARLSPIAYEHINFLGRYAFTRADSDTGLRPFHDPASDISAPQS